MADAYKILQDTSLPRALREADSLVDGTKLYETVGQAYAAGQVVLEEEITPTLREEIAKGESGWDKIVAPISRKDAEAQRAEDVAYGQYGVFVPEHEAEREIQERYGHDVVDRAVLLDVNSEGADDAKKATKAARKTPGNVRDNLTSPSTPDLATASREGTTALSPLEEEGTGGVKKRNVKKDAAKAKASGGSTATVDEG